MEAPEDLRALVQEYEVCYEVWPLRYPKDGTLVHIGFELDLIGTQSYEGRRSLLPADECIEVYEALTRIADHLAPKDEGSAEHDVRVFDNAVRYAKKRKNRPDIVLKIQILHRVGYAEPVDAAEETMLRGMLDKLRALGAREGAWHQ